MGLKTSRKKNEKTANLSPKVRRQGGPGERSQGHLDVTQTLFRIHASAAVGCVFLPLGQKSFQPSAWQLMTRYPVYKCLIRFLRQPLLAVNVLQQRGMLCYCVTTPSSYFQSQHASHNTKPDYQVQVSRPWKWTILRALKQAQKRDPEATLFATTFGPALGFS